MSKWETTANLIVKIQKTETHTQEKAKAKSEDTYSYKKICQPSGHKMCSHLQ